MSATNSTAITGQSSNVGPLVAAVALAAIVAVGAVGLAINHVGTSSTATQAKAGPAVVSESTMSGPRTIAQRGLVAHRAVIATPYGGTDFAAKYQAWLAAQRAVAATFPDYFQRLDSSIAASTKYSGSDFAGQYGAWLAAQNAAMSATFPDYFQRINGTSAGTSRFVDGRLSPQHRLPQ
jgi:hypothetical protein